MGPRAPRTQMGLSKLTLTKLQLDFNGVEACADFHRFGHGGFFGYREGRFTVILLLLGFFPCLILLQSC